MRIRPINPVSGVMFKAPKYPKHTEALTTAQKYKVGQKVKFTTCANIEKAKAPYTGVILNTTPHNLYLIEVLDSADTLVVCIPESNIIDVVK